MLATNSLKICRPTLHLDFDHAAWTRFKTTTNCYAYALNRPDMGWAHPGMLKDEFSRRMSLRNISVETVRHRILSDGLIELTKSQAMSGDFHAVALRVCPKRDAHFLRRDQDGYWSHKLGDSDPTITDSERDAIRDPENIDLYHYGAFGGFFAIPVTGIPYIPKLVIPEAA